MNRNVSVAAVDRLIAMAEDEKPNGEKPASDLPEAGRGSETMAMLPDPMRGLEDNAMLKTLLQFRMMMPYLSRMMEPQGEGDSAMAGLSAELKQSVGDLQLTQRDLRMTVQEQLVQMKRVEEEMHRMRDATEKNAFESSNLVEDMKSVYSLMKKTAGVLGAVLAALIGTAAYLLAKNPHLLH